MGPKECQCKRFAIELAAYGKVRGSAKEILGEIHGAIFRARRIEGIQGRYAEHFARAFAVTCGKNGRMHIEEAARIKKLVNRLRYNRTYPEYCLERVCAGTQMLNGAQIFKRMTLFLDNHLGIRLQSQWFPL